MNRTINMVIGIFITSIAFGIGLYWVTQSLYNQEPEEVIQSLARHDPPLLIVEWETMRPSQGYVQYSDGGAVDGRVRETGYTTAHRVEIDVSAVSGTLTYQVFSCPLKGECAEEEARTWP